MLSEIDQPIFGDTLGSICQIPVKCKIMFSETLIQISFPLHAVSRPWHWATE